MKRTHASCFAVLLICSHLSLATGHQASTTDEKSTSPLTPLAIGNTWVYENTADGVTITEQIAGVVYFDDQPWYLVRSAERPIDEPDAQPTFIWESWLAHVDGVDTLAFTELDENTATLGLTDPSGDFRYPVAKGDTYRPIEKDASTTIRVVGVDVPIKTKAGEFKCIAYREINADEEGITITTYLAPGVGVVRIRFESGGQATTTDLIKFDLAKVRPGRDKQKNEQE